MKNNLLYPETAATIIERVKHLRPGTTALWGRMTAPEMLLHANLCNREVFEPIKPVKPTTLRQWLLRIIALYISPHFKKGVMGDAKKDTHGTNAQIDFEEERNVFIELVGRYPALKGEITVPHMAFGNLSTRQWGIAAYKHMDHHLRQFGV